MIRSNRQLQLIMSGGVFIVLLVILFGIFNYFEHRGLVKITIDAVPTSSVITIDGKQVGAGGVYVKPGEHKLEASYPGFTAAVQNINTRTMDISSVIDLLPIPSSSAALTYLEQNPAQQLQREAIGGEESGIIQSQISKISSFINKLPIVYGDGQGGIVRIDEGAPITPGGPPSVDVTAATPALRQGVLTYIRSRGYDPADMDIVFYNQDNPIESYDD